MLGKDRSNFLCAESMGTTVSQDGKAPGRSSLVSRTCSCSEQAQVIKSTRGCGAGESHEFIIYKIGGHRLSGRRTAQTRAYHTKGSHSIWWRRHHCGDCGHLAGSFAQGPSHSKAPHGHDHRVYV